MTSNTPPPVGNHGSPSTVLPDPTTETEGFRAWKVGFAAGAAAERERIIRLATQLRAAIPADHPVGAQASFADYLRQVAPFAPYREGEDTP